MPVHFLQLGRVACHGPITPITLEAGHSGSENWDEVDCFECSKGRVPAVTYTMAPDGSSITCLGCGMTSSNSDDVENLYCGHCHVAHSDIWPPARRWFVENTPKVTGSLCSIAE